jgi:2-dehydro-3-deoxygluconokinase
MTAPRRIVLFGECMIELRGQVFGAIQQSFGGDTLNTAIYLTRLCAAQDLKISYATALGIDVFSDQMLAAWRAEGIDTLAGAAAR